MPVVFLHQMRFMLVMLAVRFVRPTCLLIKDGLCCSPSTAHSRPCCCRNWHTYHESYYDSDHVTFRPPFPTGQKKKLSAEFVTVLRLFNLGQSVSV